MKKAFTVIEMMIVVVIIGIGLLWVISTISYSYRFLYDTKNKITAINIARSGMEEVFNIRNTNWERWWWKKDLCWLKVDPLVDSWWDNKCENDDWFWVWPYVLNWALLSWQKYIKLEKKSTALTTWWKLISTDYDYLLCKDSDGMLFPCTQTNIKDKIKEARKFDSILYFQQVRWGYLLDKQNNNIITCSNWSDTNCGDGRSLEKNFCVDVVYFDGSKKIISYCSVLTNFKK